MPESRKAQTAVLFRDDHAEEALLFHISPYLGRQVAFLEYLVVVGHGAERIDLIIHKGLLLIVQRGIGLGKDGIEIRLARKKFAIDPKCPGTQSDLLCLRYLRHKVLFLHQCNDTCRNELLAQRRIEQKRVKRQIDRPK